MSPLWLDEPNLIIPLSSRSRPLNRLCEAPASHLPNASELKLKSIAKSGEVHILAEDISWWYHGLDTMRNTTKMGIFFGGYNVGFLDSIWVWISWDIWKWWALPYGDIYREMRWYIFSDILFHQEYIYIYITSIYIYIAITCLYIRIYKLINYRYL